MDNDRKPIYKWLSAVNYPDQSRHQNAAGE
jgi:hypothetical protein